MGNYYEQEGLFESWRLETVLAGKRILTL